MTLTPKLMVFMSFVVLMFLCSFVLQGLLSKKENPWVGLVLPILTFLLSLFWGIGQLIAHRHMGLNVVLKDFLLFSSFNAATVIHLIIYFLLRKTKPAKKQEEEKNSDNNIKGL